MLRCPVPHCGGQLLPISALTNSDWCVPNVATPLGCLLCATEYRLVPATPRHPARLVPLTAPTAPDTCESSAQRAAARAVVRRYRREEGRFRPRLLAESRS